MKGRMKTLIAAASAVAMMLQLTACGGKNEEVPETEKLSAESTFEYKSASAEITEEIMGEFEGFEYYDGRIYFLSEYYPDEEGDSSEYYLNSANTDGSGFSSKLLSPLGRNILTEPKFDENGRGYYIELNTESADKDTEIYTYFLNEIDAEGNIIAEKDITDIVTGGDADSFFYPDITAFSGGNIYVTDGYSRILVMTAEGEPVCDIREDIMVQGLVPDSDGKMYAYIYDPNGAYDFRGIDTESGILEEGVKLPMYPWYNRTVIKGSGDNEFYVSDGTSLFGYKHDDENGPLKGNSEALLEWVKAGISVMEVTDIFSDGDTFIIAGKSHPHGFPKISVLEKQPVNDIGKKEIVLAGTEYAIDGYITDSVIKFNNTNSEYYVNVKKYDDIEQLNLDLVLGKLPDILISDSYVSVDSYISKGLFADMYEYIDSDPDISRDDFLPNLLSACETDGKLYRFTDSFQIYTALGKTSVFGKDNGITIERLNEIAAERPSAETFPGVTKSEILNYALELSGEEYIDRRAQTCNFGSEQFVKLLEYANTYPDNVDDYFDDDFFARFNTMFKNEEALLMTAYLHGYRDIYRYENIEFGEEVTAVGFPCESGTGTSFIADSGIAISAGSEVRDGAWQFVRTLLLPDYQDGITESFPIRKDSLEKAAQTAMKHDPNHENTAVLTMGEMMLASSSNENIGEPKQEDIDKMNDIIALAEGLMCCDESITEIINDETAAFFAGSKSAEETAELIRQRVTLYLNEKN
ncbi:MAG: hypothetical protein ACI4XF_09070 [Oscillospiraceae bacterium]